MSSSGLDLMVPSSRTKEDALGVMLCSTDIFTSQKVGSFPSSAWRIPFLISALFRMVENTPGRRQLPDGQSQGY